MGIRDLQNSPAIPLTIDSNDSPPQQMGDHYRAYVHRHPHDQHCRNYSVSSPLQGPRRSALMNNPVSINSKASSLTQRNLRGRGLTPTTGFASIMDQPGGLGDLPTELPIPPKEIYAITTDHCLQRWSELRCRVGVRNHALGEVINTCHPVTIPNLIRDRNTT